jgi:inner membrane protein
VPSAFSHVAPGLALLPLFWKPAVPRRLWALGALCAVAPDLDVLGLAAGIPYGHPLGHRGFSHSLLAAALAAAALAALALRRERWDGLRARAALYLFVCWASHGLLDALTDGGLGVALWSPFESGRHFAPYRPIAVSPIGARFFSGRGLAVLASELRWIWLPCAALGAVLTAWRWRPGPRAARRPPA